MNAIDVSFVKVAALNTPIIDTIINEINKYKYKEPLIN